MTTQVYIYKENNAAIQIFFQMAVAAILFSQDPFQKLIRSSEIPGEQPYQILMQSNQLFLSYRAHKLFRRPSWKMVSYGLVGKKIYGKNCPGTPS